MRRSHIAVLTFAAALILALLPVSGSADAAQESYSISPDAHAVATTVVEGRVLRTVTVESSPGNPHLVSEIAISSTQKGAASGTVLVEVSGGLSGDWVVVTDQSPALAPDDIVQLALVAAPSGESPTLLNGVADTEATEVYSIVGGLEGTAWIAGRGTSQFAAVTAMASGDFNYYPGANGQPKKWASFSTATYRINPANSTVAQTQTLNAVNAGITTWENDPGSTVNYTYLGSTTKTGATIDGDNIISWMTTPNSADTYVAKASFYFLRSAPDKIAAFDIVFNRDHQWSTSATGEFGKFDIQTAAIHEIGHTLGLAHSTGDRAEIMYPSVSKGQVKRIPGIGDIQGIRGLYPNPVPQRCGGRQVTVDLAIGEVPTQGSDVIVGTNNADRIDALGGNDIVCAKAGADVVNGGPGNDIIYGQSGPDTLNGQVGNDKAYGSQGKDTLVGGVGDDELRGGTEDDKIYGGDGKDLLIGEAGNDLLFGQDDNDRVFGQAGNDVAHGGNGADVVAGGPGVDTLTGGPGNDSLFGGDHVDIMSGGAGNDTMSGGAGNDVMNGDANDDIVAGDTGDDTIRGGDGADDLRGGPDNDTMYGGTGPDLLRGAFGNDRMFGEGGTDVLYGQAGNDLLNGGDANDQLIGGLHLDTCVGGPGADNAGQCEATSSVP